MSSFFLLICQRPPNYIQFQVSQGDGQSPAEGGGQSLSLCKICCHLSTDRGFSCNKESELVHTKRVALEALWLAVVPGTCRLYIA